MNKEKIAAIAELVIADKLVINSERTEIIRAFARQILKGESQNNIHQPVKALAGMLHFCCFIENERNREKGISIGSIETEIYSTIKTITDEEEERKKEQEKAKKTKE